VQTFEWDELFRGGMRAHMRFSLATTSVGEGKKSDKYSKNRHPLKKKIKWALGKRRKKRLQP